MLSEDKHKELQRRKILNTQEQNQNQDEEYKGQRSPPPDFEKESTKEENQKR